MNIGENSSVSAEQIQAAAALVALPLSPAETLAAAKFLSTWIPAAIALDHKMQSPDLESIIPITVYGIPADIVQEIS